VFHRLLLSILVTSMSACAPPGTRPHDMSAAAHDEAAGAEDADALAEQSAAMTHCDRSQTDDATHAPCWTAREGDETAMAEHHRLAAAHRSAAEALRDAEARACVGLSDEERDSSPFDHRADIVRVTELRDDVPVRYEVTHPLVGATITVRAVPGLTAEWLERVMACHLARNAALGHDVPEMPSCPLVPRGVSARARSVGDGFAVDVRADTPEGAADVLARARSLVASGP
jgi:hypothetical protein